MQYAYDTSGNMIEKTDPNGTVITSSYDLVGNRISITNPKNYHYNRLVGEGVEERNILVFEGINTIKRLNDILQSNNGNIKEITYLIHGNSTKIGLEGDISGENLGGLQIINGDTTMNLVACNTGKGEDSFAQKLSNQLNISINAPDNYLLVNSKPSISDDWADIVGGSIIYPTIKYIGGVEQGDTVLLGGIGSIITFNPNK